MIKNIKIFILFIIILLCHFNLNAQIITTYAGTGIYSDGTDGIQATASALKIPAGIAIDSFGNVYIATVNRIRMVNPAGIIATYAGGGTILGDGGPATAAMLTNIKAIALDCSRNLFILDYGSTRIRKVDTTGIITTVAGGGTQTGEGIVADSAHISGLGGLTADCAGNFYFSEIAGNRIMKVNPAGILTTFAGYGVPGWTGDGVAATASAISRPLGMGADIEGNIYFVDNDNFRVRKVNTLGIISTVAGSGYQGFSGDWGDATLASVNALTSVAVDVYGNIYIGDDNGNRIRKVNTLGIISTIAGTGVGGYSGDGGPATAAQINRSMGMAADKYGNLYIADGNNGRVRYMTLTITEIATNGMEQDFTLFPNPAQNKLYIECQSQTLEDETISITDVTGRMIMIQKLGNHPQNEINIEDLQPGTYFIKYNNTSYSKTGVFTKIKY